MKGYQQQWAEKESGEKPTGKNQESLCHDETNLILEERVAGSFFSGSSINNDTCISDGEESTAVLVRIIIFIATFYDRQWISWFPLNVL